MVAIDLLSEGGSQCCAIERKQTKEIVMKRAIAAGLIGMVTVLASSAAFATKTYFIDQVINYPAPCTQPKLFDDTTALKSRMDAAKWTGAKFTDDAVWATDFREACSSNYGAGGQDNLYADSKAVSVFSGHGSPATLFF